MIDNQLPAWAKVVSALEARKDQSLGAILLKGVSVEELSGAVESGYARRYWLLSGTPVYRSTDKGRKTLSMLKSKQQLAYAKAAVSVPREPVKCTPYTPESWVNPRPESMNALNVPSRGALA